MATKAEKEAAAALAAVEAAAASVNQDTQGDSNGPAADQGGPAAPAADASPAASDPAPAAPAAPPAAGPKAVNVLAKIADQFVLEGAGRKDDASVALMLEACERFNVDPRKNRTPMELLAWRFLPGNDLAIPPVPDAVVIVTAGGVKLKHYEDPGFPMDLETEERLAKVFNAFHIDPKTKDVTRKPLPVSLALPASAVTGEVLTQNHIHPGGYLRRDSGASAMDAAKAARQKARLQRLAGQ